MIFSFVDLLGDEGILVFKLYTLIKHDNRANIEPQETYYVLQYRKPNPDNNRLMVYQAVEIQGELGKHSIDYNHSICMTVLLPQHGEDEFISFRFGFGYEPKPRWWHRKKKYIESKDSWTIKVFGIPYGFPRHRIPSMEMVRTLPSFLETLWTEKQEWINEQTNTLAKRHTGQRPWQVHVVLPTRAEEIATQ